MRCARSIIVASCVVVSVIAGSALSGGPAASAAPGLDPTGDVTTCGSGDATGDGGVIDLRGATAHIVEKGTAVEFRVRFARRPPAPDPDGMPWRADVLLRDPTLPAYSFGYYRDVNRLVRYDAVVNPRIEVLLLPEQGENEYFAVHFERSELVVRIPGRLLVQDEDLEGVPLDRLRWGVIARDEGSCDPLGNGRPTRRIEAEEATPSGAGEPPPDGPPPDGLPPTAVPPDRAALDGIGGSSVRPLLFALAVALGLAAITASLRLVRRR
ncbi:MAG: hypothetical protein WEA54_03570 [Actinomycetota bacterium]